MPAISMQDLENAKTDVDHIAAVATSLDPTATDRLGHVKQTLAGAVGSIAAITDRGAWVTGAAYLVKDLVSEAGVVYFCVAGHTSGTAFAGDVGNWREYQGLQIAAFAGDLADQTDPVKGAGMVGRSVATLPDYSAVRALTSLSMSTSVHVTMPGIAGTFNLDQTDTTTADNGGTVIVDMSGRRWKREHSRLVRAEWFGVKADWSGYDQTGTDDTAAMQACINYVLTMPEPRGGGIRAVKLPAGNIKVTALTVGVSSNGYAFYFIGEGHEVTSIWFDHNNPNPGMLVQIEYVRFRGITFHGSILPPDVATPATCKAISIKFKRADNTPDIDTTFDDCFVVDHNIFAAVHGRGFYFNNQGGGLSGNLLTIVADPDTVFPTSDPYYIANYKRGMRNYALRGIRTDGVSVLIDVIGTGPQKDYINGISVTGCDLSSDRIIRAIDATLVKPILANNTGYAGCRDGVVEAKKVVDGRDVGNTWNKTIDDTVPTDEAECIKYGWNVTTIDGLTIAGTSYGKLYRSIIKATNAKNINVSAVSLPHCWEYQGIDTDKVLLDSTNLIESLVVSGVTCSASSYSGSRYIQRVTPSGRKDNRVTGIVAPWSWTVGVNQLADPVVRVNGSVTAGATSGTLRYTIDDMRVYLDFSVVAVIPETSGAVTIDLPIPPKAVFSWHSSVYAGTGLVGPFVNVSTTVDIKSVIADATTSRLRIKVGTTSSTELRDLDAADIVNHTSSFYVAGSLSYRWSD